MLTFAALNSTIACGWASLIYLSLPPFDGEPAWLFVLLPTALVAAISLPLHGVVCRLQGTLWRGVALYLAFVALLTLLGVALSLYPGSSSPEHFAALHPTWWSCLSMLPATLLFGHLLAGPALVLAGVANKLASPYLTPPPG